MLHTDWVSVAGRELKLAEIRADAGKFARVLAAARADKSARCLCQDPPLPLVIRLTGNGRHHRACWPHQGPQHDPRCAFFHLEPELSGARAYRDAAIRETLSGTAIRLSVPLSSHASPQRETSGSTTHRTRRQSVGLLGTLHYLWEAARLNAWPAQTGPRDWAAVHRALRDQLATCMISGHPAQDVIYIVPPYRAGTGATNIERFDKFVERLRTKSSSFRRALVLAELKRINESHLGVSYQLAHQGPRRRIFGSAVLHDKLRKSYPIALSRIADGLNARRVVLFYIERSANGYAVAHNAAVMLTNSHYIPADSSYEVQMADALCVAGRSYVKPLIYDSARDTVLPDFVLTDQASTYVEFTDHLHTCSCRSS